MTKEEKPDYILYIIIAILIGVGILAFGWGLYSGLSNVVLGL